MDQAKIMPSAHVIGKLYLNAHYTGFMRIMRKHFNKYL